MQSQQASSVRRLALALTLLYSGIILLLIPALFPDYSFRLVDLTDGLGTALVTAFFVWFIIDRRLPTGEGSAALQLTRRGVLSLDCPSNSAELLRVIERIRSAIENAAVIRIAASFRIIKQLEVFESFNLRSGQDLALLVPDPNETLDDDMIDSNLARLILRDLEKTFTPKPGSDISIRASLSPKLLSQTLIITDELAFLIVPIGQTDSFRDRFILIEGDRRSEIRNPSWSCWKNNGNERDPSMYQGK